MFSWISVVGAGVCGVLGAKLGGVLRATLEFMVGVVRILLY